MTKQPTCQKAGTQNNGGCHVVVWGKPAPHGPRPGMAVCLLGDLSRNGPKGDRHPRRGSASAEGNAANRHGIHPHVRRAGGSLLPPSLPPRAGGQPRLPGRARLPDARRPVRPGPDLERGEHGRSGLCGHEHRRRPAVLSFSSCRARARRLDPWIASSLLSKDRRARLKIKSSAF